MSLAHSRGDFKGRDPKKEGWILASSRKSEKKARCLSQPSFAHDAMLTGGQMNIHVNGNTKPQEPTWLLRRPSGSSGKPRVATHIHQKPWTSCPAIGRKENPHMTNEYHRVWTFDAGRMGRVYDGVDESEDLGRPRRWNRKRKQEHYEKYEAEMNVLKPHDEVFAVNTNAKFWTHLQNRGTKAGGQEKIMVVPKRSTGLHLKHGLYEGKFSNVQHAQLILKTGRKNNRNETEEWMVDTRPMFDNRLHDDQIKYNEYKDKEQAQNSFDISRPSNTRSCPQMGADYMHR
jgi:hypothetical protein